MTYFENLQQLSATSAEARFGVKQGPGRALNVGRRLRVRVIGALCQLAVVRSVRRLLRSARRG